MGNNEKKVGIIKEAVNKASNTYKGASDAVNNTISGAKKIGKGVSDTYSNIVSGVKKVGKGINDKVNSDINTAKKIGEIAGTAYGDIATIPNDLKTWSMRNKLANKMMDKEYPSGNVVGGKWATWKKRHDETREKIGYNDMSGARKNLQGITEKFYKDNPDAAKTTGSNYKAK